MNKIFFVVISEASKINSRLTVHYNKLVFHMPEEKKTYFRLTLKNYFTLNFKCKRSSGNNRGSFKFQTIA